MPRPKKYATAKEAAENNLFSKMGGARIGFSLKGFIAISTGRCFLCGREPRERLVVTRSDGTYKLMWNYIVALRSSEFSTVKLVAMCKMCRLLHRHFDIKALISHCARIMARRMWKVHSKWFSQAQEKPSEKTLADIQLNGELSNEQLVRLK
jgi:hypothetical protein